MLSKEKPAKKKNTKLKLRNYRKQLNSDMFDISNEIILSENNSAALECRIGKVENIFSPFDISKNRTISDAFHNYLMQETEIIPARHELELRLYVSSDITNEQMDQIKKAIKRHYSFTITSTNLRLKKTNLSAIFLYFAGLLALIINFLSSSITSILPLRETLLIITWFLVWEATGIAFFDRKSLITRRFNMLRIYNATVNFVKEEKTII